MSAFYGKSGIYMLNVAAEISLNQSTVDYFVWSNTVTVECSFTIALNTCTLFCNTALVEEGQFASSISLLTFLRNPNDDFSIIGK